MKLYHGTNIDFMAIDIRKSHPYKDFGQGFYLTDIRSQAEDMAVKKTKIYGGTPIVQEYLFGENAPDALNLNVLKFEKPCKEWASFIYQNRNRTLHFHHDYDIVIGPIANDGVAYLLGRYEEGTLSIEDLAQELEYKKLNSQYFFGTEKALALLKRL